MVEKMLTYKFIKASIREITEYYLIPNSLHFRSSSTEFDKNFI